LWSNPIGWSWLGQLDWLASAENLNVEESPSVVCRARPEDNGLRPQEPTLGEGDRLAAPPASPKSPTPVPDETRGAGAIGFPDLTRTPDPVVLDDIHANGDCPDGTWFTLARMPSRRQEISTAVLNGEIFVIAGYNENGQSTSTVEAYNPKTDSWREIADLPIATNHNAAAVADGTLYAFGGTSNRVFAYDPDNDAWSDVAPMRYDHGNTAAVAVINEQIYVVGGTGPGMIGNELERYDPATDSWTTLAPMTVPRNHTGGGVIDGKFYVVAGRGSADAETALEVYDPKQDSWARLTSMPTGRSGVGVAAVGECLYVFGGEGNRIFPEVEVYHPATDSWQRLGDMRTPRHGLFASVIGNSVYLPGGGTQPGFGATDTNEVFVVSG
jgi:N-acetylneuraminic acid mutarotase